MLKTTMAPPSAVLQPYVWSYGMTLGRVDSVPRVIPLPARPKQLLTFFLRDRYRGIGPAPEEGDAAPRVVLVGPQTRSRAGLLVFGCIDNFTIHFQPAGFNSLFGFPMTELTDADCDAHAVLGRDISALEDSLGDTASFSERILRVETYLIKVLAGRENPDRVAVAANRLFAADGRHRVSAMADHSGLSPRQFERRFLTQVGVPPKLYARIIRFNAAVDRKLRCPSRPWSRIATEQDYYDQMHLVHDCRDFTGESPSQFTLRLGGLPEFHTLFAAAQHTRRD